MAKNERVLVPFLCGFDRTVFLRRAVLKESFWSFIRIEPDPFARPGRLVRFPCLHLLQSRSTVSVAPYKPPKETRFRSVIFVRRVAIAGTSLTDFHQVSVLFSFPSCRFRFRGFSIFFGAMNKPSVLRNHDGIRVLTHSNNTWLISDALEKWMSKSWFRTARVLFFFCH